MIKLYFVLTSLFIGSIVYSQTQYASSVIEFSTEYSTDGWGANQSTGEPNTGTCDDNPSAWASQTPDGRREFLVLGYAVPQKINKIEIFQTYNPGAIDSVSIRNASTGVWTIVYSATAIAEATCPVTLTIDIALTSYDVDAVRIAMNSPAVPDWNEIDAVGITNSTTLPVYILSFTAGRLNEGIQVKWSTATEINASYFEVERSTDGSLFEKVTALPADNLITGSDYEAVDPSPSIGINYYRLKMVEIDGKISYSSIVIINFKKKVSITVFPNPTKNYIMLKGIEDLKQIRLMDNYGKVVKKFNPSPDGIYSVENLKPGLYILEFINGNGIQSHKLILQ